MSTFSNLKEIISKQTGLIEIEIVKYLFQRLHQLGIRSVHGVPGDFNLVALDYLDDAGLTWVGNCNELNAAYAADGYARVKGISALITTFGVGELSALAGVAGAYSEHVPVIHIVGVPSTAAQRQGALLHHTLGNGDFSVFTNMSKNVSQTVVNITDPSSAAKEIDRALRACYISARPVYITLPTDMVQQKVSAAGLNKPIDMTLPDNDAETEADVIEAITKQLYEANNAIILADACAVRHRVVDELHELIEKSQLPAFATPMSKSAIDETNPRFGGVYIGNVSRPDVKQAVESSDLILSIGALKSDFNSGGFTYRTSTKNTIEFHSDHIKVGYATYPGIAMQPVLQRLLKSLDFQKIRHSESAVSMPPVLENIEPKESESSGQVITHSWFWPHIGRWLQPNDVVITETGTSNFGILETRFPKGVTAISQVLWGSIGYSVGSCLGAALAIKETDPSRRVILFVGEGSLQLTVQEISSMIRHKLSPILVVINNDGYTIERMIHGKEAGYNDIQPWRYTKLLEAFGAVEGQYKNYVVKTRDQVDELFVPGNQFSKAEHIQLVELFMPKLDAPRGLLVTAEMTAKLNAKMENS